MNPYVYVTVLYPSPFLGFGGFWVAVADAVEDFAEVVVDAVEEEMTKVRVMEEVDVDVREVEEEEGTGEEVLVGAAEDAIKVDEVLVDAFELLAVVVPLVSQLE